MTKFKPKDEAYEEKIRSSFAQQGVMQTIGASLVSIQPGQVEIAFDYDPKLTQQNGFIHAGISTTVVDSACGYAALSLMPAGSAVLTVEFKVNLLSPAIGERFIAVGKVKKTGRTISVCEGDLIAVKGEERKVVATMLATMMCLENRNRIEN